MPLGRSETVCACGHPAEAHEHIPGVKFEAVYVVNEDGTHSYGLPDVWVCSGGRLVDVPEDGDIDPWDCVCGCVLHEPPIPPATRKPTEKKAA